MIQHDITFHPSWWHKNADIQFTQDFFDEPEYRMDCDVKMRKTLYEHFGDLGLGEKDPQKRPLLGTDLLAAGYLHSQLMGCDIVYQPDNSPQVVCRELDEEQIKQAHAPDLAQSPVWQATQKQIDYLTDKYGRVEPYVNLMGVQNIAMDLMGQELFMAYYEDEDAIHGLLREITKLSVDVGRRFRALSDDISGGVTAIVRQTVPGCYLTSNCSVEMVSQAQYEEFLLPYDVELANAFGSYGIHHCGQTMEHVVAGYAKVPHLTFAEVGAGSDIAAVRRALPETHLNARVSPAKLADMGDEAVAAEVRRLYEDGRDAAGGRLSISCVGIDKNMPEDNLRRFLQACAAL